MRFLSSRKKFDARLGVAIGGVLALALVRVAGGCSSSGTPSGNEFESAGGGNSTSDTNPSGGKGGGSSTSTFVTSSGTQSGASTNTNSGTASTSSGTDPDAACAATTAQATLIPVNMYIMFDDSGSMAQDNKWTDASAALKAFFGDPATAGLRVALRFFPDGDCDNSACSIDACATAEVNLAALTADPAPTDTQEQALDDAVDSHGPAGGGGTPLSAALQGAENFAIAYQTANPTEKAVVILVTDGAPNGCDEDPNDIAGIAATAFASNGILTYSVGLEGSNETLMNSIATSGSTSAAFFIGTGSDATTQLVTALTAIEKSQVTCTFAMPMSDDMGNPVDPSKVNVEYTPGGSTMPEDFGKVTNAAACGMSTTGWYYDDNMNPTTITLCPDACTVVQADSGAKIQVLAGCDTVIDMPH
ncbi:MAG TPA: vWA domain-containing protein [Byssovorax sp.]